MPAPDAHPGRVVAGDGQAGQHRPDDRAEREMERLGPLGELGQDLRAADDDLDREQDRRSDREADQRRVVALRPPGDDREAEHDDADHGRDPAMEDVRGGRVGHGREERAVHQRPIGEDERRRGRGHMRPEQQQRERRRRS